MSSRQLSRVEVLLPAASVIVLTNDQAADLEEAVGLTLAALELSGHQQQAAGVAFTGHACMFLMCPCVEYQRKKMVRHE